MRGLGKHIAAACIAIPCALSCRGLILENRLACPEFVFFDVKDVRDLESAASIRLNIRDRSSGDILGEDRPLIEDISPDDYHIAIRKTKEITVTGVAGLRMSGDYDNLSAIGVPTGYQGDPIYRFVVDTLGLQDEIHIPVVMLKDHSKIKVRFRSDDGTFPYRIVVKGNTAGTDLLTGQPIRGRFRYEPPENEPGVFEFIVPRQIDYLLALEIWAKPGMTHEEGYLDDFILWSVLQKIKGFDWDLVNLPDISVEIDFARSSVTLCVNDWEIAETISYTI